MTPPASTRARRRAPFGNAALRLLIASLLGLAVVLLFRFVLAPKDAKAASSPAGVVSSSAPAASAPARQDGGSTVAAPPAPSATTPSSTPSSPARVPAQTLKFNNGQVFVEVSARGARVRSIRLKGFSLDADASDTEKNDPERCLQLVYHSGQPVSALSLFVSSDHAASEGDSFRSLIGVLETADWTMEPVAADAELGPGVEWRLKTGRLEFVKRLRLHKTGYVGELSLEIANDDPSLTGFLKLLLVPGGWVFSDHDSFYPSPVALVGQGTPDSSSVLQKLPSQLKIGNVGDDFVSEKLAERGQGILFVADANKYFVAGLVPKGPTENAAIQAVHVFGARAIGVRGPEARVATAALLQAPVPNSGQRSALRFHTYFGPKRDDARAEIPVLMKIDAHDRASFLSVGWLTDGLVGVLRLFASITGSWGVAIILLTFVVRLALFPLNRKSQATMARFAEKQQILKPKLDELAKRYKNNAKKLNEEKMKLLKEHGATPPLMGCLPPFLQIPIFVGLFSALRTTYELRQQPFIGWIRDLSRPDELVRFKSPFHLPLVGEIRGLNVLPLLMVVLWIVHQKMMPKPSDPQQAQIQKMMIFMPILFGLMLYNYASGLSLYMITSSTLGIIEQTVIRKYWPPAGVKPRAPAATVVAVR